MQGSLIMMPGEPKGVFFEGTITGTPYPGTVMQISAGVAMTSGDFQWGVYNPLADNDPRIQMVLIEDKLEGTPFSVAYTSGTQGFLYCPINGEFMNMLVAGQQGTGNANQFTIGERMGVVHGTGLLQAQATSANSSPWMVMEAVTLTPDVQGWVWCMRTYHN